MSGICHCGHDLWDHFLDEINDDPIFGQCNEDDCNCTEYHVEAECELPHHEAGPHSEE